MEVFGAVGTAISLIQMTRTKLGRARRVGRNIDDLRDSLGDLLELEHRVDPQRDAELLGRIHLLVDQATELLEENQSTGPVAALRFMWTSSLDDDVDRISRKVNTVYMLLNQRIAQRGRYDPEDDDTIIDGYIGASNAPSIKRGKKNSRTESMDLGSARRSSMSPVPLPTILYLYDADGVLIGSPIPLEKFCILERNPTAKSRTIQYESADQCTVITHEISFGTIPSTPDDLEACEVSFLDSHIITIETLHEEYTYAEYKLEPLYKFAMSATCNDFMAYLRERTLLASFLPHEVIKMTAEKPGTKTSLINRIFNPQSREVTLSRWKVVRLWEREIGPGGESLVTMTFHDRSKNPPKFTEWSLKDFRESAITLRRGRLIELSRYRRNEQFMFIFQSSEEARYFKETFERKRPH